MTTTAPSPLAPASSGSHPISGGLQATEAEPAVKGPRPLSLIPVRLPAKSSRKILFSL